MTFYLKIYPKITLHIRTYTLDGRLDQIYILQGKISEIVHFFLKYPIGVQKPGPSYSPAIVVYTLHSIIMVLLYYIYLLGTYHWLLSLILSVHFRNYMHLT